MLEKLITVENGLWVVEGTPSVESEVEFNDTFNKAYRKGMNYINKNVPIGRIRNRVVQAFGLYLKGELTKNNNPLRGCVEETAYFILTLRKVKNLI